MPDQLLRLLRRTPILGTRLMRAELERRYQAVFGRLPNIDAPSGFNEWILHRTLYDRDPRLPVICDKLAVREFIRERAGTEFVVPLLGVWTDPASIPWETLPERFVLKPNHSSGPVALVRTDAERDPAALSARAAEWLKHDFFDVNFEWGYRNMPRRLLAEPLLTGPGGAPPAEMRILTFHGKAALIRVLTGEKRSPGWRSNWFDVEGRPMPISTASCATGDFVLATRDARRIAAIAERVSTGFSHLRVDFYLTDEGPKIGELTAYLGAGMTSWQPTEWDEKLGRLWSAGAPADSVLR
jgi:hypothetical protein